jgi:hypothetical protein
MVWAPPRARSHGRTRYPRGISRDARSGTAASGTLPPTCTSVVFVITLKPVVSCDPFSASKRSGTTSTDSPSASLTVVRGQGAYVSSPLRPFRAAMKACACAELTGSFVTCSSPGVAGTAALGEPSSRSRSCVRAPSPRRRGTPTSPSLRRSCGCRCTAPLVRGARRSSTTCRPPSYGHAARTRCGNALARCSDTSHGFPGRRSSADH